jgi:hypothetical protein
MEQNMSKNDITGDKLVSKANTDSFRDGWDRIFKKNDEVEIDLIALSIEAHGIELAEINREIDGQRDFLDVLTNAKAEILGRTLVKCVCCSVATPIKDIDYIQTHYYTSPHGCSGGDYWNEGSGKMVCPNCNTILMFLGDEYDGVKYHFKRIIDEYDK